MKLLNEKCLLIFLLYLLGIKCFNLRLFTTKSIKSKTSSLLLNNIIRNRNTNRNKISSLKATISSTTEDELSNDNNDNNNDLICDINNNAVTDEELCNENLVKIVLLTASDQACNELCWKCLGYTYNNHNNTWNNNHVFPKWKLKYPQPVDLIGTTRIYDPKIDLPVRKASIDLMRAIPRSFKGGIRNLQGINDFQGFSFKNLTPNITRRAQLCNFIMYYRDKLHNKSLEQLILEKNEEPMLSEEERNLPSEKAYQKLRLDVDIEEE